MVLDGIEQLVPAKPGAPRPEVAAWHHDNRPHLCGIDDLAQCIIWVQSNDNVIVARHAGPVLFRAARHTTQNPAARIHDVAVDVMALAENPGQHSLSACDVSRASGLREPGGNEFSRGLEPPLVAMKTMCRHRQLARRSARLRRPSRYRTPAKCTLDATAAAASRRPGSAAPSPAEPERRARAMKSSG